ncbi:MAG: hypothetical protein ABSC77_14040 [Terracidiphilus sp.]|jgi:hypothetical protein
MARLETKRKHRTWQRSNSAELFHFATIVVTAKVPGDRIQRKSNLK